MLGRTLACGEGADEAGTGTKKDTHQLPVISCDTDGDALAHLHHTRLNYSVCVCACVRAWGWVG